MNSFWRDVRFGTRLLLRNPGFTAAAVMAFALGIAANTAIFSVVYATLLAPLPYPEPDQLVMVWSRIQGGRNVTAAGDFLEWKKQATAFQGLNAFSGRGVNLASNERPEQVAATLTTPGFLSMMGHRLEFGRDFTGEEGTTGRNKVVVLTHKFWTDRFAGDRGMVGRPIRIDGSPHTVVGILAPGPADRLQNKLYLPLAFAPEQVNHDFHWLLVMGRLKPGVTLAQANADMKNVTARIAKAFPASNTGWSASVEPLKNNFLSDNTKTALWLLLGAVGFVLLIACANVANLLLARGTARQRELAVRASVGASPGTIARQLIVESLVLAMAGGALGVALAYALVRLIMGTMPEYTLPSEADVRLSLPVLLFTLAACAISGVLFGSVPAWQAARQNISETLKEGGRVMGGARHRLRLALVVVEFGLALTLLSGGGLAIHSLLNVAAADLGFNTEHLLTFSLPVPNEKLTGPEQVSTFYEQLLARVQAVPGVLSASVSTGMPVSGTGFGMPFTIVGKPVKDPGQRPGAGFNMVTPDYFKTFGIRMTRGRAFTEQDRAGSVPVAIVNDVFVSRYFKGVDPLTQRLLVEQLIPGVTKLGPAIEWQIVGVYAKVRNAGPKDDGFPEIDVPFWQSPWPGTVMAVRSAGAASGMQQGIAAAIRASDADLPMADVKTMEQLVHESMAGDRFMTVLFASFAAVALALAAFGIFGVMSFVVAQRTHDIGLRMALGAGRRRVLTEVLREGMGTALVGVVVGTAGAYGVGRAMQGMVYGVGNFDLTAFFLVVIALLGSALAACLIPARRAASVDPMVALREE
jgi:putative ABC transport system permease protein